MTKTYTLSRAAELEVLPVFRDFIQRAGAEAGLSVDVCDDLKLAVDEACTNIIAHGYAGMDPGSIILDLRLAPDCVEVRLTDFGHAFEPSEAPAPDVSAALDDRPMGGFGLFFIYSTMDQVDYQTNEDGNCLTLTRRL
jgi:serine/threonine-protein kinase RsbW